MDPEMPVNERHQKGNSGNPSTKTMKDGGNYLKDILNPEGPYPYTWNKIFLASCVLAVGTDPLFFYIPTIYDDKKCVATDDNLKIAALVMRCFADIFYITDIYYQIRNRSIKASPTRALSPYFISIDFMAVIPLPQAIILFLYSKVRGPRALDIRRFLDFLVFAQYVLRIVRTYLSTKELKRTPRAPGPLVHGLLNLFLYVTASHVLGAFWYFLSAQRQIGCWRRACRHHDGCDSATFDCNENTLANRTFLNDFCPVDPPNATVFDFGIFLDALQNGVLGPMDFPKKFLQCYWWGLRNLSSFGSNLDTSTFAWETWFAILVSVIGLLLFLYLIGNLQTYMQLATAKSEEIRQTMLSKEQEIEMMYHDKLSDYIKIALVQHIQQADENKKYVDLEHLLDSLPNQTQDEKKKKAELELVCRKLINTGSRRKEHEMQLKMLSTRLWMKENNIPEDMKPTLLQHVRCRLEDNKDIDLRNMLSILPREDKNMLKKHFCLASIKKVLTPQSMGIKVRETFISYLKPTVYSENSYIIRKGEPLDLMLFIIEGVVWSFTAYDDNGSNNVFRSFKRLDKGAYYGEEFLNWALTVSGFDSDSSFPISSLNVRCHTKVEALVLTANDLMAFKRKQQWLLEWACLVLQNAWRHHKTKKPQMRLLIH
ncbi:cyclic nucleotide-gated ion channel 1 [Ziziphus jujuba]|uniref:Cyclic nucleotide-gated ion channel 1 n=1 Tax=Ziziphus jujuba TaxID=326968 RepID=A0ABM4AF24_ZIZJJ|nr:cyclic nucleotide-gated ion channel 1 [Ziziphus jujuba]